MKPHVRVSKTKEEALFDKWENEVNSQQGSSSEEVKVTIARPSGRAGSSANVGISGT